MSAVVWLALLPLIGSPTAPARAAPVVPPGGSSGPTLPVGGWPLAGVPEVRRGFEPPEQRWGAGHRGVDLAAAPGQVVLAAADGVVGFAGQVAGAGVVTVVHGAVRTTYTPVTATVRAGQPVTRGQPIGTVLAGHCADAPGCLHWGLLRGEEYLDPLSLVAGGSALASGPVRMLPADAVARVRELAAARAAALAAGAGGPSGRSGFALPVAGPITSAYGMRTHPVTGVRSLHDGTDIGAACGTTLVAPAAGTVVVRDHHPALGERLVIDHGTVAGRRVRTAMGHAASYDVGAGQAVVAGQPVGRVGSTGLSTGCHLHLMVWLDGTITDPMGWF